MADAALGIALASGQLVATVFRPDNPEQRLTVDVRLDDGKAENTVKTIDETVERLLHEADRRGIGSHLASVGASLGGHIDHERGIVRHASDLIVDGEPWDNVDLASMLTAKLRAPAVIENDVNCMVEFHRQIGRGQGRNSFVVVYLAPDVKGLGSGILIDGKIVRGATGGAGEFGHVVVQPGGPRCYCRNRGCLQAVLNTETLVRNVNWGERHAVGDLAAAARLAGRGDPAATEAFRQAGRFFGQALSMIVNMLNPSLLILGGPKELVGPVPAPQGARPMRRRAGGLRHGVRNPMPSATLFTQGYEETLAAYSFCNLENDCSIEISELTLETAAMGAALLGTSATTELTAVLTTKTPAMARARRRRRPRLPV